MPEDVDLEDLRQGTDLVKRGFAKMQKGGVIMDVTDAEQAGIAEDAGAVAVMALEAVPADIRDEGGVARMADPAKIQAIIDAVTIPVMAKCRIGHTVEAKVLETVGADMIDESEVLTPADPFHHVDKSEFDVPFVCGARDLGEALRRVHEGAAMIRTKGEAGTGNIVEAVRHRKQIRRSIRQLREYDEGELFDVAKEIGAPVELVEEVRDLQRLPVVDFAAGGIATPSDAALMMHLGSDGVFVGSGIFKASDDPAEQEARARAIVEAVHSWDEPQMVAKVSAGLGKAMSGLDMDDLDESEQMQDRGW